MAGSLPSRAVPPLSHPFRRRVRVSGSKSLACRALAAAALSEGVSAIRGRLDAGDIAVLAEGLRTLGVPVERDGVSEIRVAGLAPQELLPARGVTIDVGMAGFPARLLSALAALSRGPVTIAGAARMGERPMRPLVEALVRAGCPARCLSGEGLPVRVEGGGTLRAGTIQLGGSADSSQFLSALLLLLTRASGPAQVEVDGPLVSAPYAEMTAAVARSFGLRIERTGTAWKVAPGAGRAATFEVEPDASSAGIAFVAAAVTGGEATIEGLSRSSGQPDVRFLDVLEQMGCRVEAHSAGLTLHAGPLRGVEADLSGMPDSVPALAALAAFAEGTTTIRGVAHLRLKESDRIAALCTELGRLGVRIEESGEGIVVRGSAEPAAGSGLRNGGRGRDGDPQSVSGAAGLRGGRVDPRGDHRIAMACALLGLRVPGVVVEDPGCVAKSFPGFWEEIVGP